MYAPCFQDSTHALRLLSLVLRPGQERPGPEIWDRTSESNSLMNVVLNKKILISYLEQVLVSLLVCSIIIEKYFNTEFKTVLYDTGFFHMLKMAGIPFPLHVSITWFTNRSVTILFCLMVRISSRKNIHLQGGVIGEFNCRINRVDIIYKEFKMLSAAFPYCEIIINVSPPYKWFIFAFLKMALSRLVSCTMGKEGYKLNR